MADVRRPPRRARDSEPASGPDGRTDARIGRRSDDRGQLLLVGALALAVVFVALALLLNTAIYTGNLATRDAGGEATPAIEYTSAARDAGVDAIASVNRRNGTSSDEPHRAFVATTGRWDDLAAHHRIVAGDAADVDVNGTTNGTRIRQDDASRNFTDASGSADWTVVSGMTSVRSMRFTVDESELEPTENATTATTDPVFTVNVAADPGTRSVYVYDNSTSGDPEVLVVDGGTETVCSAGAVTDGTFAVDVPNASVDGAPCPALGAVDDDNPDAVDYADGDAAGGTYTMVVDEPESSLSLSGVNGPGAGAGSPYWTYAIYGAELDVTYRTDDIEYEATIEVIPQ